MRRVWLIPLFAASAAACSVFESKPVNRPFSPKAISYFLPIGRVHLVVDHKVSGSTEIAVNEQNVADTSESYYAQVNGDSLSKDNFKVTTKEGLLQQVTNTSEDQSPVVATNLAVAVRQTIELLATAAGAATATDTTDLKIDVTFDPFDKASVGSINDKLAYIGGNLVLLTGCSATRINSTGVFETGGFLYRPAYPYELIFNFTGGQLKPASNGQSYNSAPAGIVQLIVNLPSKCSPIMSVVPARTAFGKNETTINFVDGSLADVSVAKDSEVAGFSQIPVNVTSELLKLPADLATIRYNNVSNQDKLVNGQAQLLTDQAKLVKDQQDLIAAQRAAMGKPASTAQSTSTQGGSPAASSSSNPIPAATN